MVHQAEQKKWASFELSSDNYMNKAMTRSTVTVIIDVTEGNAGSVAELLVEVTLLLTNCGPHAVDQLV